MKFLSTIKMYLIIGVIAIAVGTGAYLYISSLRSSIKALEAEKAIQTYVINTLNENIKQIKNDLEKQKTLHDNFQKNVDDIRREADEEAERLGGVDWEYEANTDREALERDINERMKRVFDDMKEISR